MLCLKRSSKSWADAFTGAGKAEGNTKCAEGRVPCAPNALQTICVDPDKADDDCPITEVSLIRNEDINSDNLKNYRRAKITDDLKTVDWTLVYSQKMPNLPMSRFKLTQLEPCSLD